jgi:hypothetical protein
MPESRISSNKTSESCNLLITVLMEARRAGLPRRRERRTGVAEIVLGLASSHTPQMSTSAEFWTEHAARDERNARLLGRDGRYHSYDDQLREAVEQPGGAFGISHLEHLGAGETV